MVNLADERPLVTECSHIDADCNKFILDKLILQDKSLTPARLLVSAFGRSAGGIFTLLTGRQLQQGLKVSSGPCHDRATALAESSSCALIGDHVCTCDPS